MGPREHPAQRCLPCRGVPGGMGCCNPALSVLGLMRAHYRGALAFIGGSRHLFGSCLLNSHKELIDLKSGGHHFPSCRLQ